MTKSAFWLAAAGALLVSACNNTYGPPPDDSRPQNWGQQHYLDNQRYQETIDNGQSD
jgi:hypothetical protein